LVLFIFDKNLYSLGEIIKLITCMNVMIEHSLDDTNIFSGFHTIIIKRFLLGLSNPHPLSLHPKPGKVMILYRIIFIRDVSVRREESSRVKLNPEIMTNQQTNEPYHIMNPTKCQPLKP
jgi:hypothetical protein